MNMIQFHGLPNFVIIDIKIKYHNAPGHTHTHTRRWGQFLFFLYAVSFAFGFVLPSFIPLYAMFS